jgi:aspartate-semialdehyde dehydrogenase
MKVAVVGATGLVGTEMLKVLAERNFPVSELIPVATEKSLGKTIFYNGLQIPVVTYEMALQKKPDVALFSAGGDTSLALAPKFAEIGCKVIDNSSAWRMKEEIKLLVPEVNAHCLTASDMIIANPNCSTIQLVVALAPLHRTYQIKRLIISTYQSITGTGVAAVTQLENERNGIQGKQAYHYKIDKNCIPHCDVFNENGYTKEELKLKNETRKILEDNAIGITATAVRVPVVGGHSESINVTFDKPTTITEIHEKMRNAAGVVLQDNPEMNVYPMPLFAHGKDAVFVGRIREDESFPNTFNMWVVADNLRKGAATNAVQIAELMLSKGFLPA